VLEDVVSYWDGIIDAENVLRREISHIEYYRTRMNIPAELVSIDPTFVPEGIDLRLAHRYLLK